jgi:hypothetical protein
LGATAARSHRQRLCRRGPLPGMCARRRSGAFATRTPWWPPPRPALLLSALIGWRCWPPPTPTARASVVSAASMPPARCAAAAALPCRRHAGLAYSTYFEPLYAGPVLAPDLEDGSAHRAVERAHVLGALAAARGAHAPRAPGPGTQGGRPPGACVGVPGQLPRSRAAAAQAQPPDPGRHTAHARSGTRLTVALQPRQATARGLPSPCRMAMACSTAASTSASYACSWSRHCTTQAQ